MKNSLSVLVFILISIQLSVAQHYYSDSFVAQKAGNYVIDGVGDEAYWDACQWYDLSYVWIPYGGTMTSGDFAGRVKFAWTPEVLLIYAEIEDDVLSDTHIDPRDNYWNDDCFEVFLDEDYSGGWHQNSYNAFAYHCAINEEDVIDIGVSNNVNLKDHIEFDLDTIDATHYTWELAIRIFNDSFDETSSTNTTVSLVQDKEMGIAVAYCDNDGGNERENFIGLINVDAQHFNSAWQDASVFGKLTLSEDGGNTDFLRGNSIAQDIRVFEDANLNLVIDTKGNVSGKTVLTIYDLNGRLLKESIIYLEENQRVDIQDIIPGAYIITLRNETLNYSGLFNHK